MAYPLENALFQWEEGRRALQAIEDPRQRRLADRVVDAIRDELRRRIGPTFSAEELAELYGRAPTGASRSRSTSPRRSRGRAVARRRRLLALPARRHRLRRRPQARGLSYSSESSDSDVAAVAVAGLAGAADDDLVGLDADGDVALAGPVLGVDGVVLDRGVEPEAVAVLSPWSKVASISLRRPRPPRRPRRRRRRRPAPAGRPRRSSRSSSSSPSLVAPRPPRPLRPPRPRSRPRSPLRSRRGGRFRSTPALSSSGERSYCLRNSRSSVALIFELVGDPGIGAALVDPGADLVQLRLQ